MACRGDLSFTATDSSFTTFLDKLAGRNVVDVRGGNIGIEIRMGVNYAEAVVRRGMALEDLCGRHLDDGAKLWASVAQGAIAAGRRFRYHHYRPGGEEKPEYGRLHLRDYSPWEGWEVEGWPTTVILRGKAW